MCGPFKWKTLRWCCLWLCRLIFVQKFLWESSKTTRTKTCREENKEQWMETKTGATGASQEACATTCFTRKTCSWTTKTKGASKSSRFGQACSCSTGKTALILRACPGIGKKNKFCLIVSRTTLQSTASLTFRLPVLWVESEPVEFLSSKCFTLVLFIFFQPRIPPPDYKPPPEKLGYLRHVTPAPKQVIPDNFHVESVHLRHAYPPNSSQSEKPRYAHLLRKTGKRGELGIKDDDDSEVTRICFNVPLVGVTWKQT